MQIIRLDKLHPNLHQADSMVLAADRCFSTEFIALWIQTHGQRVQTETRPLNPTESFPGDRAALQYHVREDTPREKGNKGDAGDDGLSSAVGQGTEHEGWALGPFPPSRRWLCNAPQFFCNPNKFKARTQQKAISPPPSPFPPLSPQTPRLLLLLPPDGQPAQLGPVRAVPGVSEPGTSRLLHGRNSTYAPPCRASCLRLHSNPGDTCSGPSQVPGPAPPAPGPLRPSESPQGSEHLRCQGKASAGGGASSAARPAHRKCSEFLAGQNGGCWGYLFNYYFFFFGGRVVAVGERRL